MIDILLATYNSCPYLCEQLDSLFAQEYQDFRILIRDGGSADDTLNIIHRYEQMYPGKIHFLGSSKSSALENFSELLKASIAELVMFCDHDDVWLPQKIGHTLTKYREAATAYGPKMPILVFTDSLVADQEMKVMSDSMLRYQHLNPSFLSLNRLIFQNVASGNTMLINRALIDLASPIPSGAVIHDHWITLAAAAFGKIVFLNEATVKYRQHGTNVYGAFHYSIAGMIKKLRDGREKIITRIERNIRQAVFFGKRYEAELSVHDREMLSALTHWDEYGFIMKRMILLKYHILKSGLLRNLGLFIAV